MGYFFFDLMDLIETKVKSNKFKYIDVVYVSDRLTLLRYPLTGLFNSKIKGTEQK